ncbi:hypothetical protein [Hymenobacter wooponensis]|uniref:Uncharacterized protein n=1 Tax=Hymenobacter wooponensis TaxID=1525360 RepID=A0A4Z0MM12_9BACT|nr:hypothetical protein [Hymenobacter wooponensis]TGD80287.1 hypothetical protein EU557_10605 [Hymenobacter wooponensis]
MLTSLLLLLGDISGSSLLLVMTGILTLPVLVLLYAFWRWSRRHKPKVAVEEHSNAREFEQQKQRVLR